MSEHSIQPESSSDLTQRDINSHRDKPDINCGDNIYIRHEITTDRINLDRSRSQSTA